MHTNITNHTTCQTPNFIQGLVWHGQDWPSHCSFTSLSRVLSSFRPTDSRFICDPAWRDQKQTTNSGPSCNKKQVIQWNRSIIHVFVSIREHKKTQCQVPTVSFHPARLNPIPVIATSFSGCTFRFIVSLSCSSVGNSTFRSVVPIKTRSLMDPVLY